MDVEVQGREPRDQVLSIARGYVPVEYAVRVCRLDIYRALSGDHNSAMYDFNGFIGNINDSSNRRLYTCNGRRILDITTIA